MPTVLELAMLWPITSRQAGGVEAGAAGMLVVS
jgi:hypothetical protein